MALYAGSVEGKVRRHKIVLDVMAQERSNHMKIKKIELEMTKEEKDVFDSLQTKDGFCDASYSDCLRCPLKQENNGMNTSLCKLHYTLDRSNLEITVAEVPMRLYEGIDVSKLQTRDGRPVLFVTSNEDGSIFPFFVLIKEDRRPRVMFYKKDGTWSDSFKKDDIIWKG